MFHKYIHEQFYYNIGDKADKHIQNNMYVYKQRKISDKNRNVGYVMNISTMDSPDIVSDNNYLIDNFGDDLDKHMDFFERHDKYLLAVIVWALKIDNNFQINIGQ